MAAATTEIEDEEFVFDAEYDNQYTVERDNFVVYQYTVERDNFVVYQALPQASAGSSSAAAAVEAAAAAARAAPAPAAAPEKR